MDTAKTIGIIGGGQLGRMLTLEALPLGFKVIVVDPSKNCPAAQVGAEQIVAGLRDAEAIKQLAQKSDYITIEIEHLDADILKEIEKTGTPVNPAAETIQLIQDKYNQKLFLQKHNLPVADFTLIKSPSHASVVLKSYGGKMILKTRHNAYDGRGNAVVTNNDELTAALQRFDGAPLYAEKLVQFKKELAVMVAKDMAGNVSTYPVVETIHQRNICVEVVAPAQITDDIAKTATRIATDAIKTLAGAGVFGVELFLLKDNQVIINEIAPRVHNSGHYTMDACATSQFEQHIRAISDLPLGSTALISPAAVMINILGERNGPTKVTGLDEALREPNSHIYFYGKSPTKIDRKMGHINTLDETVDKARKKAQNMRKHIGI